MKKFDNYRSNLRVLQQAHLQDLDNDFIISGIIDKFFIQFELGWKTLKELLLYEGVAVARTGSPREIIKAAYRIYDSLEETTWLDMLAQRNNMSHMYDATAAKALVHSILDSFIPAFQQLQAEIESRYGDILLQL